MARVLFPVSWLWGAGGGIESVYNHRFNPNWVKYLKAEQIQPSVSNSIQLSGKPM